MAESDAPGTCPTSLCCSSHVTKTSAFLGLFISFSILDNPTTSISGAIELQAGHTFSATTYGGAAPVETVSTRLLQPAMGQFWAFTYGSDNRRELHAHTDYSRHRRQRDLFGQPGSRAPSRR